MNRQRWILASSALIGSGGAIAAWLLTGPTVPERDFSGLEGSVERGAYVARLTGCIACHTDVKSGKSVLAGGAAIKTEFGDFYPPNITPHSEDGIGNWSLEDFSRALTAGQAPDGSHYYPSFPYAFYTRLSNQEIIDLWAAVNSVPPVKGKTPDQDLAFPFNLRLANAAWGKLFLEPKLIEEEEDKSEAWNRGRYLAEGPAHCGACHTPRNLLGARITDQQFAGAPGPNKGMVPPITSAALKKRNWTREDLVYGLRTGLMPDGDSFGSAMAEVVRDGTRYWTNEDLDAIATYLLDPDR